MPVIPIRSRVAAIEWLWPTAFLVTSISASALSAWLFGPSESLSYTAYMLPALAGAFVGVIAAWVTLGTLSMVISEDNGFPFQAGDCVRILSGKQRGKDGEVEKSCGEEDCYVQVNVEGESESYNTLDLFLLNRVDTVPDDEARPAAPTEE